MVLLLLILPALLMGNGSRLYAKYWISRLDHVFSIEQATNEFPQIYFLNLKYFLRLLALEFKIA